MFIRRITLKNLLSFGPDTKELELAPLNVLIGPNGSGKSNLIEAISLLHAAPRDLTAPIREGGGVGDWIWRGEPRASSANIEAVLENPKGPQALRYRLGFAEKGQRFELVDEQIANEQPDAGHEKPYFYFELHNGRAVLNYKDAGQRQLRPEEIDPEQSILAQRKDPDHYPELTYLGEAFGRVRLYREWSFGRYTPPRLPQKADLPNDFLVEDAKNLGLVLNRLKREPKVKRQLLDALCKLYEGVTDFDVIIEVGTVQVFFQEGNITIPATRLSDGTLRYLCLLAILCHPKPPPLVCLEEPELGLHPDILPSLSELLREASERCQLVVTTHSDVLVDALTDTPESIVVCEKHNGQTEMRRLEKETLTDWLERYSLGQLWRKGELGGNRW
jgi:predicted ATPase